MLQLTNSVPQKTDWTSPERCTKDDICLRREYSATQDAKVQVWLPQLQAPESKGKWPLAVSDRHLADLRSGALQCDETKPHCKSCTSFGLLCNFTFNVSELQPTIADATSRPLVRRIGGPQSPIDSAVWTSDEYSSYQLNARCQEFITRYLGRSLITPNDPNMRQANRRMLQLAFTVGHISSTSVPADRCQLRVHSPNGH